MNARALFLRSVVFACVLLAGCERKGDFDPVAGPTLKRVVLPGFSLQLPEGEVKKSTHSPYAGTYQLVLSNRPKFIDMLRHQRLESREIRVLWQSGYGTVDDVPAMPGLMAKALGMELEEKPAPAPGRALGIGSLNGKVIAFGFAFCGGVSINLIYGGPLSRAKEVESTARKILVSLECTERSLKLGPLLPHLEWPFLYGKVADERNGQFYALDGDAMYVNVTTNDVTSHAELMKNFAMAAIRSTAESDQLEIVSRVVPYPGNKFASLLRFDWVQGGQPAALYFAARYCPELDVSFMTAIEPVPSEDAAAVKIANGVQCPGDTEPPPPTVDAAFGAACRAGDQLACDRWKELAAIGEAAGP